MTLTIINQTSHWYDNQPSIMTKYQPKSLTEQMVMTIIKADLVQKFKKYFPDQGSLINYRFQDETALIHQVAKANAIHCLAYMINADIDVNVFSSNGLRPLEYAIESNAIEACALLRANDAKAYDMTLIEIIDENPTITTLDGSILTKAINFVNEYQAVTCNLKAYLDQLCLCIIEDKNDNWFLMSMKLIMKDHQLKLTKIKLIKQELDNDTVLQLLNKYQLTKMMVKPYMDVCDQTQNTEELLRVIHTLSKIDDIKMIKWQDLEKCYGILTDH